MKLITHGSERVKLSCVPMRTVVAKKAGNESNQELAHCILSTLQMSYAFILYAALSYSTFKNTP